MKIEHTIRRPNGTEVLIDKTTYHFLPDETGRHVAEVADKSHIQKFLKVETFQIADDEPVAPQEPAQESDPDQEPEHEQETEHEHEQETAYEEREDPHADLYLLDKHALSKEYEVLYGEPPAAALRKMSLIEAIVARRG